MYAIAGGNKTIQSPDRLHKHSQNKTPFFQPKLTINEPGDQYEQEADHMAEQVMQQPANDQTFFKPNPLSISRLQRKCQQCEEEENVHRKENTTIPTEPGSEISSYIGSLSSKGSALPDHTRHFFETGFRQDFSDVKIHNDADAAKSSQSISALAYTFDNNIVFNQNQFSPDTEDGKKLLAHELTHVVQQRESTNKIFQKKEATCADRYKNKATEIIDKKTFDNQLAINLDSWTPYLIDRIGKVVNEIFDNKEKINGLAIFGHAALETGKELLDLTPLGEVAKVGWKIGAELSNILIETCGEASRISSKESLDDMKSFITQLTHQRLVAYKDDQLKEGKEFIDESFKMNIKNSKTGCDDLINTLSNTIDHKFPRISEQNFKEIQEIVEELVNDITKLQYFLNEYRRTGDNVTEQRMRLFWQCRRPYLPENGQPSEAQSDEADLKCHYLSYPYENENEANKIINKIKYPPDPGG